MSGQFHDVIIIGAGPAGSYIAYELASLGHDIAVFEEKSAPGLNSCCTGIISTECFRSLDLGADEILTRIDSARFFSPSGRCLRLQTQDVQAYVVNRLLLDKEIASKAQSLGAQYHFSSLVVDVVPQKDNALVETLCSRTREIFKARAVVLAGGFKPRLPVKLGLGRIKNFLVGAQAEIEARNIDELEVYFSQEVAPGAFAWLVPTSPNTAYVGLLATSHARLHLQKFINDLFGRGRVVSEVAKIEQKPVPVGNLARSYGDRILAIGDAAGQVKPTTGGGIYFGHIGARVAAGVLDEALRHDNLTAGRLSRYQKQWKAKMGKELSRGRRARWAYAKLSDRQIEGILNAVDASGTAEVLLNSSDFSFDWHSKLIMAVLKRSSAYPLLKIKRLLYSEAGS